MSGVLIFVKRPLKIQMFGSQKFMFEPTLNLFSRYVSTVGSKRRYNSSRVCVDGAGRDSCRFYTMCLYWCTEDLNWQFSDRSLQRTSTSQDRFALRQLLWPDFSTGGTIYGQVFSVSFRVSLLQGLQPSGELGTNCTMREIVETLKWKLFHSRLDIIFSLHRAILEWSSFKT